MGRNDLIIVLFFSSATLFTTSIGFAIAWVRARERALRARLDVFAQPTPPASSLAQLERSIEAIAIEVERISEGQRFTSKLLADRADLGRGDKSLARAHD